MDPSTELLEIFVDEAAARLDAMASGLLRLERIVDADLVTDLFREAHTLKGAAAVVGLDAFSAVAHAIEDILSGLRTGTTAPTGAVIDALLAAVDGLRGVVSTIRSGGDTTAECERLRAALIAFDAGGPRADPPPAAPSAHPDSREPVRSDAIRVPVQRLDTIVRLVGESAAANLRVGRLLVDHLGAGAVDFDPVRDLARSLNELQEITMRTRMVPVGTILEGVHRAVRDTARDLGKAVRWEPRGTDTELDRGVLDQLTDPLIQLVRNAVDHGIEAPEERATLDKPAEATVGVHAMQVGSEVIIAVTDDGRGIDLDLVRARAADIVPDAAVLTDDDALNLVFRSGLSTAERVTGVSGRGIGLDVVRVAIQRVRGRVEVRTEAGVGTEFRIRVPITLAVLPCLLVTAAGLRYAIPLHSVVLVQPEGPREDATAWVDGAPVPVVDLAAVLGFGESADEGHQRCVVVVTGLTRRYGFAVDELLGERDVVVKGLPSLVPPLEVVAGASIEPDGTVVCVLDGPSLVDLARTGRRAPTRAQGRAPEARSTVLVVDDALTIRELQRAILERAGYDVITAGDGQEAIDMLSRASVDLVLADVEMPRMDGFTLTRALRDRPRWEHVPIVILTSRASDEDRRRGLEAGADRYMLKSSFDQGDLIAVVRDLLGPPQ